MKDRVHRLSADFEIPVEDVKRFFEDYEPPGDVDAIDVRTRGNKLILDAVSDRDASNYTPSAILKADLNERRLYRTEDGWAREAPAPKQGGTEEVETKVVEYVCFKGGCGTVLQNTALQGVMLRVLVDLAKRAGSGEITAITSSDEGLEAIRVVEGEELPAEVEVVDPTEEETQQSTSNWRDNSLIS